MVIHDTLNMDIAADVEALSEIVYPASDCLLDMETCVLNVLLPR